MPSQRILVIGGVAAGPAAAVMAKRTDPAAEVCLFEQGPHISYGACEMPYVLGGRIPDLGRLIILTPEQMHVERGVQAFVQHRVTTLHPERRRITVEDVAGGQVRHERYDKLVLAIGAHARMPGLAGEEGPNVTAFRTLDDTRHLLEQVKAGHLRHVVILGAGYVGLEVAEALVARNCRVTLLAPDGQVLKSALDEPLRAVVQKELARHGVAVRAERATHLARSAEGRVKAVHTDAGEQIGCQHVVVAIGLQPNTALAQRAGVKTGRTGALSVDTGMRTNIPQIWACGDCIEVPRVIDGQMIYHPLAPVAFRTGRVAGQNAARRGRGPQASFPGVTPSAAVKVFDLEVASVGLTLASAQAAGWTARATTISHWSRVSFYPGAQRLHVTLITEKKSRRLLGAQLVGAEGAVQRANVLLPLIADKWTADKLYDLDLIYSPPFAPSLDPLVVAARSVIKADQGAP